MTLFPHFHFDVIAPNLNSLKLSSPLGEIFFDLKFDDLNLMNFIPNKSFKIKEKAYLHQWDLEKIYVEFIKIDATSFLNDSKKVQKCLCGIWRIRVKSPIHAEFSCNLNCAEIEGNLELGEGLYAQTWENSTLKLGIGTEDEDYLNFRASNKGFFPQRLKELISPDMLNFTSNSVFIKMPQLLENEKLQVHFVVAWDSKESVATWLALDMDPEVLLKWVGL